VFGKHAGGHVFPMLLTVQSMPDADCFIGIMQELKTSDEFVWFMSESKTVVEATKGSFGMLQVLDIQSYSFLLPFTAMFVAR
jgi:hypothetical protein